MKRNKEKINSVCKFEFVEFVKSKNIDQNNKDLILELFAIDLIKNKDKFEINLKILLKNHEILCFFICKLQLTKVFAQQK